MRGFGPGRHVVNVGSGSRLEPGLYVIRLTSGRESRVTRVTRVTRGMVVR